jgi:hypothetical protein
MSIRSAVRFMYTCCKTEYRIELKNNHHFRSTLPALFAICAPQARSPAASHHPTRKSPAVEHDNHPRLWSMMTMFSYGQKRPDTIMVLVPKSRASCARSIAIGKGVSRAGGRLRRTWTLRTTPRASVSTVRFVSGRCQDAGSCGGPQCVRPSEKEVRKSHQDERLTSRY